MIRLLAFILIFNLSILGHAEKKYKRSFPLMPLVLEIAENERVDDLLNNETIKVPEKFKLNFEKFLRTKIHDYSDETLIEVDRVKKLVHVTSNLKTMYQIMNLFGDHYSDAAQLKFHFTLIEVKDSSELLKLDPVKVRAETLRSLPKNQFKIISESDLFTQNGNTAIVNSGANKFELTPQLDPDGYSIEVEFLCTLKDKFTYIQDTRYKCTDRSEIAFQLQTKDSSKRSNKYLLISAVLVDYSLKPLGRFTKKEVVAVQKEIIQRNELKGKLFTRFYTLSVGMSSGGENEREEYQPDFKGYFIQNGINFTEEESVTFVPTAMRIVIKARESTHIKIEKHLKDISIVTPQRKIVLRVFEAENEVFEKLKTSALSFVNLNKLKGLKVIDNYEHFAASGKTVSLSESDKSGKTTLVSFECTSQSNLKDTETHISFALAYQKHDFEAKIVRDFTIKNGAYKIFELQRRGGKTAFVVVYADKFIVESEYWFGN